MRYTQQSVDSKFEQLMGVAKNRGVDITHLRFGQHTGDAYYIAYVDPSSGGVNRRSPEWMTRAEAWRAMHAMVDALQWLPKND